jgi:hypothetical protein
MPSARRSPAGAARRVAVAAWVAFALAVAWPAGADASGSTESEPAPAVATERVAQAPTDPNALTSPATVDRPPPGHVLDARGATAIADIVPKIRDVRRRHRPGVTSRAFLKGSDRWQVSYYDDGKEIGQVLLADRSGRVVEAWTGFQVAWSMARGYPGAFGRRANAWYVWVPLCLLFVAPFVDPRRPLRLLHLDLLVLVGALSVSLAFFNHGRIGLSVPLAVPPLVYLLIRMLLAGFRPRAPATQLRTLVPWTWLLVATVFLVGFRVGLNVADGNVIDVGYSGVISADRLTHGEPIYAGFPKDDEHGDTYGPVNAYAYVPFEQAFPWSGRWDDLPAAHGAAVAFDLLTIVALFLLGRRIRGPDLGAMLAYGWVTFPFTLLVSNSGSNDALVALLVVVALLVAGRPVARGAAVALAGLTKFAPLALAPLFATYAPGRRTVAPRRLALFALGFAIAVAVAMAPVLLRGDLQLFYDRTIGYQNDRGSPFSPWGLYGGLDVVQAAVKVAGVALALLVALVPRRRDLRTLAALGAAVLILLQLGLTHWFYLYAVWWFPLVLLVLLAPPGSEREPQALMLPAQEAEAARSRPPVAVGSPG